MPRSFSRRSAMIFCRSSRFLPDTRTWSSWMDACTLTFESLMRRTISRARSMGVPCCSAILFPRQAALDGDPLLQPHLLPEHAAAALLDLAVGERIQGHAALVQARLEDVDDRLQLHVVGRGHRDVGLLELHVTVGALQVVARRDLPAAIV